MVLARDLIESDMGVWIIFMIISAGLESLRNAFVYNSLVRFVNINEDEERGSVTAASFVHNILYTLLFSVLVALLAEPLKNYWNEPVPELATMLYVLSFQNLLMLFYTQFLFVQQANLEFKGLLYLSFLRKGLFFVYVCYYFFVVGAGNIGLVDLAIAQTSIIFLLIPLTYLLARPFLTFDFKRYGKWTWAMFHFGKYNIGTNLSSLILGSMDSWMLGRLIATQATALYNPAIRVMNLVEVPLLGLAQVFYPKITKKIKEEGNSAAKEMYEISVAAILMVMIPIAIIIMVFAEPLVLIMAGKKYIEAVPILRVTALFTLIIPFNRQFGVTANALGRAKFNFIFVIINAVVNGICNYIFIQRFGVIGAAYGTLTAYIVSMLYTQISLNRMIGVNFFSIIGKIFTFYRNPKKALQFNNGPR